MEETGRGFVHSLGGVNRSPDDLSGNFLETSVPFGAGALSGWPTVGKGKSPLSLCSSTSAE